MMTAAPASAQRRDGNLLPQDSSGQVVAVGCLARGDSVRGGKKDSYVLVRPKKGPVASVAEATCTAEPGADALTIDNPEKGKITDAALGRWVEIGGRLERETDKNPDNLRELDVATFKLVPVVVPTRATAPPEPTPALVAEARPTPQPEAAAPTPAPAPAPAAPRPEPQRTLPKTASQMPAMGLAGLLLLGAALTLRSVRLRRSV
jgi:LPXTG-motif cell wall-anchored protein